MSDNDTANLLRFVSGGLYRNPLGAELHAIEPLREFGDPKHWGPLNLGRGQVFGEIWIVETRDDLFGTTRHLATREGLAMCGYTLASARTDDQNTDGAE